MTKHTAGKYGRTIGQKERKAGWPSPAMAWCYLCNGTHRWQDGCAVHRSQPAGIDRPGGQHERTAVAARS